MGIVGDRGESILKNGANKGGGLNVTAKAGKKRYYRYVGMDA